MRPRVAVIGAMGRQGRRIVEAVDGLADIVAIADPAAVLVMPPAAKYQCFASAEELVDKVAFDAAIVSVPHDLHLATTKLLLERGKPVIKEKPFANNLPEAHQIINLAKSVRQPVFTMSQRRCNPVVQHAIASLPLIGLPYAFEYRYYLDRPFMTEGWRASVDRAFGGVGKDMGYHLVDLINLMFGLPSRIGCLLSYCFEPMCRNRLDDYLTAQVRYNAHRPLVGTITIGRHHIRKHEKLEILGDNGVLVLTPDFLKIHGLDGSILLEMATTKSKEELMKMQLEGFLNSLGDFELAAQNMQHQLLNVQFLSMLYAAAKVDDQPMHHLEHAKLRRIERI